MYICRYLWIYVSIEIWASPPSTQVQMVSLEVIVPRVALVLGLALGDPAREASFLAP